MRKQTVVDRAARQVPALQRPLGSTRITLKQPRPRQAKRQLGPLIRFERVVVGPEHGLNEQADDKSEPTLLEIGLGIRRG